MTVRIKWLYLILFGLLAVNILMLVLYLQPFPKSERVAKDKRLTSAGKPAVKPLVLKFENKIPDLNVEFDKKQVLEVMTKSGFLENGRVVNLASLASYRPSEIRIEFYKEDEFEGLPLMEMFRIGDRKIYGYYALFPEDRYELKFHFASKYLDSLTKEEVEKLFNSSVIKAIVRLSHLGKKKRRLTTEEERQALKEAMSLVKKYQIFHVR